MKPLSASLVFFALATVAVPVLAEDNSEFLALKSLQTQEQTLPSAVNDAKLVALSDQELNKIEGGQHVCVICANVGVNAIVLGQNNNQNNNQSNNPRR
jgi:hypothetical protein